MRAVGGFRRANPDLASLMMPGYADKSEGSAWVARGVAEIGADLVHCVMTRLTPHDLRPAAAFGMPAQPVDATQALNLSAGVSNARVLRGRSFS
jgi:hypothetical protein